MGTWVARAAEDSSEERDGAGRSTRDVSTGVGRGHC